MAVEAVQTSEVASLNTIEHDEVIINNQQSLVLNIKDRPVTMFSMNILVRAK